MFKNSKHIKESSTNLEINTGEINSNKLFMSKMNYG